MVNTNSITGVWNPHCRKRALNLHCRFNYWCLESPLSTVAVCSTVRSVHRTHIVGYYWAIGFFARDSVDLSFVHPPMHCDYGTPIPPYVPRRITVSLISWSDSTLLFGCVRKTRIKRCYLSRFWRATLGRADGQESYISNRRPQTKKKSSKPRVWRNPCCRTASARHHSILALRHTWVSVGGVSAIALFHQSEPSSTGRKSDRIHDPAANQSSPVT